MSVAYSRFSLFKRRNGLYSILYCHHGRRRWKATNATTKAEALAVLADFQNLLSAGSAPPVPLQEFVSRFLAFAESTYSPASVELYKRVLSRFVKLTGNLYLLDITGEHFDRYKAQRLKDTYQGERLQPKSNKRRLKSVSPVSVNIELRALRAAMNTARRWKLIHSNPFQEVAFANVPEVAPAFFTAADFQGFLNTISEGWLREVVLFAVLTGLREGETGLRRGELLNLRWTDFDSAKSLVTVQSSNEYRVKGGKMRIVPVPPQALAILDGLRKIAEWIFCTPDGEPFRGEYVQKKLKKCLRAAGLPEYLHWHSLRHTHGTLAANSGVPIHIIKQIMGHSSVKTTEMYTGIDEEAMQTQASKITLPSLSPAR